MKKKIKLQDFNHSLKFSNKLLLNLMGRLSVLVISMRSILLYFYITTNLHPLLHVATSQSD
jgi:hypothetical protein